MRKIGLLILTLGLSLSGISQDRCHTDHYVDQLIKKDPELETRMAQQEEAYQAYVEQKSKMKQSAAPGDIVNIPVVFHVVYKTNAQNIPDIRILEQINQLNMDYSASNPDTSIVPLEFKPFISDTKIRFLLATVDPDGNPTNGITRDTTSKYSFDIGLDDIKYSSLGGVDAWDTDEYLNIWVGNISSGILGYAMPPVNAGNSNDGVVIGYSYVGYNNNGQYDKGRTATHEVGHYLGLEHVWGQGGCFSDDGIQDTPMQSGPHYGVSVHPIASCESNDMFTNYMDYGNDEVLVMFTTDQKTRMEYSLDILRGDVGMFEPVGIEEEVPELLSVYPNPSSDIVNIDFNENVDAGQLNIIDITGRTYHRQNVSGTEKVTIDVSNFVQGLYFIQFKNNTQSIQHKIVIR